MLKKIIGVFVGVFFLVLGAVVAIPFLFKDEINAMIKEQINKELLADVEYSSYDLSILRSFPDLYFTLNDLSVVGRGVFEGDTLAAVDKLGLSLELMKLVRSEELLINALYIEHPTILAYQLVTEEGDTLRNYDVLPTTEDEVAQSDLIDIVANEVRLVKANVYYKDFIGGTEFIAKNMNLQAAIEYKDDVADMLVSSKIDGISYSDGSMTYLNDVALDAELGLYADLAKDSFFLRDNVLALNDLKLYADGFVSMPEEGKTRMDLSFSADQSSFKELLSIIPAAYLKDYESLQANGLFTLNGLVKGELTDQTYPAFDVSLNIADGELQYPDLPKGIENINLDARIYNASSDYRQMNLDVPKAKFVLDNEPVELSLYAKQLLLDPWLDLKVKGDLDLSKVPSYYPLEGVNELNGQLHADLQFKGLLSNVENERFDQVDFAGDLAMKQLRVDAEDLPMAVNVDELDLQFNPAYGDLKAKNLRIGESDFQLDGQVENMINYLFADGTVKGNLDIQSQYINLNELIGEDESEDETTSTATKVPANIEFTSSLTAKEVYYDGLKMSNVGGKLKVEDEVLSLQNLSANMLGGSAQINGSYATKNTEKPVMNLAYKVNKFDIKQTFEQLNTVQAIAPIAKYLTGSFSTDMELSSFLNNDMSLDLSALSGLGEVRIPYATFNDLPIFQKVSETVKLPAFDKPTLNNAWTILKFEDGKVNVEPFEVKMKDVTMQLVGSNGFDKSIDYQIKLNVPSDKFGGAAGLANDFLAKQNIPLLNLSVPQSLTFHLNVGGMMNAPTVSIAKVTADQSDKGVKEQLKENLQNQLDNAKEQAKEEVDKVKENIQNQVDDAKDKAKEEAQKEVDKVKEDIKENIKDKFKGKGFGW